MQGSTPTKYGPAERLAEQIDILLRDPGPTEIVVLSTLGEAALPRLCAMLDTDTRGKRQWKHAVAVIRALGMSAHPSVVPSLALRLNTYKPEPYNRSETEPRAITHALRKVGNDEALRALMDNLNRVDLQHMKTIIEPFGQAGRDALIAKMTNFDQDSWLPAAKLVTAMKLKEGVPLLVHAASSKPDQLEPYKLLAYYGKDADKEWALKRLLDLFELFRDEYARPERRARQEYYGGHSRSDEGIHPVHDALLRILFHAGDPSVLTRLAPYVKIEQIAALTRSEYEPSPSVTLLALAFGEHALPHLADEQFASAGPAAVQGVKDIRKRIEEQAKQRAEAAKARERGWHSEREGTVKAPAFRLEKSPLGDEELKGESDPLPSPRSTNDSYYEDAE